MAQAITCPLFGHFVSGPGQVLSWADLTATAAAASFAYGVRWVQAMIYQKAFTGGTGTLQVKYAIELASVEAFNADVVRVAHGEVARADEQSLHLIGFSPLKALKWARIVIVEDGTDAATFDAVLAGA